MTWLYPDIPTPARIQEAVAPGPDPIAVYRERYQAAYPQESGLLTAARTKTEIFDYFAPQSSVLLLGSGHSFLANQFVNFPTVAKLTAVDYVVEASLGLDPRIDFQCYDFSGGIQGKFDYIYSAHTIEHFSRQTILETILPNCLQAATKAVVFLVPYAYNWQGEPSHRCYFFANDELTARASRYKLIRDGIELVLWFETESA